jgi:hypothetical protein
VGSVVAGCSTVPFFFNNWLVSGNVLTPPFLMANHANYTGDVVSHTATFGLTTITNISRYFTISDALHLVGMPASGALGLIVFGVAGIAVATMVRHRQCPIDRDLITLVVFGVASFTYYFVFCGFLMHTDTGIMPDIRYTSAAYAPMTIAALAVITRLEPLVPRREIRTLMVGTLVAVPLVLLTLVTVPMFGASYPQFNHLINLLLMLVVVCTIVTKRPTGITMVAVILIVWQLGMSFVYGDIKINGYPYLPIVDWLHHTLFVW